MTDKIYPPDWHFSDRSTLQDIVIGDLFPSFIFPSEAAPECVNCGDHRLVYARKITQSGPLHWVNGRRFHARLLSAPCPVCRGEFLAEWLEHNCGLAGLELEGKPALEIRVTEQTPLKGQADAFDVAWSLLSELPTPHSWALFTGQYGTGKTHVLVGLVNACRIARIYALYTKTERILSRLKATFDPGSTVRSDEVRRRYEQIPVLVIDELDRVKWTEWAGEQLFAILDERYLAGRPTWFASNAGPGALSETSEPLAALVSRMSSGFMVAFTNADLRTPQQQEMLPDRFIE